MTVEQCTARKPIWMVITEPTKTEPTKIDCPVHKEGHMLYPRVNYTL